MKLFIVSVIAATVVSVTPPSTNNRARQEEPMQLGAFSISLAVKDIQKSKDFYQKLDFEQVGGDIDQNWLILRNGTTTIGLFQGMFEDNILTFNPGWGPNQETFDSFEDVRQLQKSLKERGLELTQEADESTAGPASFTLIDPDGNPILFDQHVDSPQG